MNYDLIKIKEKYGEKMMHLCRTLFPTLLEKEGLLFELIENKFAYSKFLYKDIVNNHMEMQFKNYIYSLIDVENNKSESIKSPKELLNDAGYNLYECKTEDDIQCFKKYYKESEELCTFNDNRLDSCYVFFAVKKDVDKIKREDFKTPTRQDEYGTSVISIQFSRGKNNTLSIKNRYNHTVNNPDATFSNNLENIISGLTESFEHYYNLNINQNESEDFELPNYVKANDGKFYKYNYEINNIYYGPNNLIVDNFTVIKNAYKNEKHIIIDYFVLDLEKKRIYLYDEELEDGFLKDLGCIGKIEISKNKENKNKTIKITFINLKTCFIEIDEENKIIAYTNENLTETKSNFLVKNEYIKEINLPNVEYISGNFLPENNSIEELSLPKAKIICSDFLVNNKKLKKLYLPNVTDIKHNFLYESRITNLELPNLIKVGDNFLYRNSDIKNIDFPELVKVGRNFIASNENIEKVKLDNLSKVGDHFLYNNEMLEEINLPGLFDVGSGFIKFNTNIKKVNLPKLYNIESDFMYYNRNIENIDLPNVNRIGKNFMHDNDTLKIFKADKLEFIGDSFLRNNKGLEVLKINNVKVILDDFLFSNNSLEIIVAPELLEVGSRFMQSNNVLQHFFAPKLDSIGRGFMFFHEKYKVLNVVDDEKIRQLILIPDK